MCDLRWQVMEHKHAVADGVELLQKVAFDVKKFSFMLDITYIKQVLACGLSNAIRVRVIL